MSTVRDLTLGRAGLCLLTYIRQHIRPSTYAGYESNTRRIAVDHNQVPAPSSCAGTEIIPEPLSESCLRRWMAVDEVDTGRVEGVRSDERAELVELRRRWSLSQPPSGRGWPAARWSRSSSTM